MALQELQLDSVSDRELRTVRAFYLTGWGHYRHAQPRLQADPELGHIFTEDLSEMVNTACVSVLTILGNMEKNGREGLANLDPYGPKDSTPAIALCDLDCGRNADIRISNVENGQVHHYCSVHSMAYIVRELEAKGMLVGPPPRIPQDQEALTRVIRAARFPSKTDPVD
jgi:hypothetical protein